MDDINMEIERACPGAVSWLWWHAMLLSRYDTVPTQNSKTSVDVDVLIAQSCDSHLFFNDVFSLLSTRLRLTLHQVYDIQTRPFRYVIVI